MIVTQDLNGITAINADSGMALRRKTDKGPTQITRVALAAWDSTENWADCEYAQTEAESAAQVIPAPRTFSKLRIVAALTTAGVWDLVKQLLVERGLYDLFLAAQDFAEDNEYFAQGTAALQSALGWTDAQVEAVLAASEGGV